MSTDVIAVRFREYDTHMHARAVTNKQDFYDHEVRPGEIHNGTEVITKRLGNGAPKKIFRADRFGYVRLVFKVWNTNTLDKIMNLRALADSQGRIIMHPVYEDDSDLFRIVLLPDEQILDNLLVAGRFSGGDEVEIIFDEVEHPLPFRQILFRNVSENNLLSTTDDDPIEVTQVDSGNSLIRLSHLPNIACLFEPESGKQWALQHQEDTTGSADPSRTGDYTHQLKITEHSTYTKEYLYKTKWLQYAEVGRGTIADFGVGDKVCLYNPFLGFHDGTLMANYVVQMSGSGWRQTYVGPGGLLKHTDGEWILLVNGYQSGVGYSVGSFKGAALTSASLVVQNSDNAQFVVSGVASNWREDQIFAGGSVLWIPDENKHIVYMAGYSSTAAKWRIAYAKFDEEFYNVSYPSSEIIDSSGSSNGFLAPSVLQYKGKYWMAYIDRSDNANPELATGGWKLRYAISDEPEGTFVDQGMLGYGRLTNDGIYRSCHMDNCALILWKGELYCISGGTSWYLDSGTRANRVFGLWKYNEATAAWEEDIRSPIVFNPLYGSDIWGSSYQYCSDHTGGYPTWYLDELNRKLYFLFSSNTGTDTYMVHKVDWDLDRI